VTGTETTVTKRYSVTIAVWDTDYEEYTPSDSMRDNWVDALSFDTPEEATTELAKLGVDAAYLYDETEEDEYRLIFP
jgi:hypothetical protein